jgi:hypothetical protein
MNELDRALAALAATQHGVVSIVQARKLGFTVDAIRHRCDVGIVERAGTHVVRFPGVPRTWRQALTIGLLDLGGSAIVGGRSAAVLLGLDGFQEGPVELVVPRSARRRSTTATVTSSSRLCAIDRIEIEGFPCASAPLAIVQLAGTVSERQLESAVDSALRLGWTSETFLRTRLAALRHRGRKGVVALDRVLDGRWPLSARADLPRDDLAAGLPRPACQRIHREGSRFVARTDFSFEPAARLIVEVAGHATHATRRQRQRDAQRHSELQLLGFVVLTFTWEDVTERPSWVLSIVRRGLLHASAA